MIYVKHDFFSNFTSSVSVGDTEFSKNIIANELSDIIIFKTNSLISVLEKINVKCSKKDSYEELLDKVIDKKNDNQILKKGLAFLIAENNGVIDNVDAKQGKSLVDKVFDGIVVVFSKIHNDVTENRMFKSEVLELIKVKLESAPELVNKRKLKKRSKVLRNVAIFSILVGGIYLVVRYRNDIFQFKKKDADLSSLGSGQMSQVSSQGSVVNNNLESGGSLNPESSVIVDPHIERINQSFEGI